MAESDDQFISGFHGIPSPEKLRSMSFVELAELLSRCEAGSAKFLVTQRELQRRLNQDQARINRMNIIIGGLVGGAFTVIGVVLGAWLKSSGCLG